MKKNNLLSKTKERIKKFFIKLKNKDASFFVLALCVCLLSTALIWRFSTKGGNKENNLSQNEHPQENGINANMDPYNDYVNKVKDDYEKKSNEKKDKTEKLDLNSMKAPLAGEVTREYSLDKLQYFESVEEWRTHTGIDIKPKETLMIQSAFEGTVEKISQSNLTGTQILISHSDNIKTLYSNLSSAKVKAGDKIEKGQIIGNIGKCDSIEAAEGPHLHFEITVDGKTVNPLDYIPGE